MKLKELILNQIKFVSKDLPNGTIVNVKYLDEPFQFQLPKGSIEYIGNEHLTLNINNNLFFGLIGSLEDYMSTRFNRPIESIISENFVQLKLPFRNSRPEFKVLLDNRLFNYHNLISGMEVICIVSLDKLWITDKINYTLTIKDILLKN
jgi:hypothetical protein